MRYYTPTNLFWFLDLKVDPEFKRLVLLVRNHKHEIKELENAIDALDKYAEINRRVDPSDAREADAEACEKRSQKFQLIAELKRAELKIDEIRTLSYPKVPFLWCPKCGRTRQVIFQNQKQR